jgi:hypothetical protein
MNKERLLLAARVLREAAKQRELDNDHQHHFNMCRFVNDCGTPACVLGHYAVRKDVQELFALGRENIAQFAYSVRGELLYRKSTVHDYRPTDYCSLEVRGHFDVDEAECEALFGPMGCHDALTEEEAADFIEKCVAEDKIPLGYADADEDPFEEDCEAEEEEKE